MEHKLISIYNKMKKFFTIFTLFLVLSCAQDPLEPITVTIDIPENLKIESLTGIKTESVIVQSEVRMNVKLPYSGVYRIKIKDIKNNLISQEKITAKEGDNLLKVYVNTLPKSSYQLILTDDIHKVLGIETIVVN